MQTALPGKTSRQWVTHGPDGDEKLRMPYTAGDVLAAGHCMTKGVAHTNQGPDDELTSCFTM
jgi:hypothetical protein